eukprot:EG_transcript_1317
MTHGVSQLTEWGASRFKHLVSQLNGDFTTLAFGNLDTECERSQGQLNETQDQLLRSTAELVDRVRDATAQAQGQVAALVSYFGGLMQAVVGDFQAVAADYASRLRLESASRAQDAFYRMLRDRIRAIQMVSRLHSLGAMNFSRVPAGPLDDGSCTLMAALCQVSAQFGLVVYIGSATGASVLCDITDVAYELVVRPNPSADLNVFMVWPPFRGGGANFTAWKQSCLAGSNASFLNALCPHGLGMKYPNYCNGTCGFDPRCRPWYVIHDPAAPSQARMSQVYIDVYKGVPCVTLSYGIHSASAPGLVAIAATDFYFDEVDAFLNTLPALGVPQHVALIFNSSDLLVVATNRPCPTGQTSSGISVTRVCDPGLQLLGSWLGDHRGLAAKASLELDGTLWDVFPSAIDGISYFVAVGMNRTEVYAVITAANQQAHDTLQAITRQEPLRIDSLEAGAVMDMVASTNGTFSGLRAAQSAEAHHAVEVHARAGRLLNATRLQSTADLDSLLNTQLGSTQRLQSYHVARLAGDVGPMCGAVAALLVAIILAAACGARRLLRHVHRIARVLEDVAHMRVEEVQVTEKSSVKEVQSIETALGVLVRRLAQYKSYMPAGLLHRGSERMPSRPQQYPVSAAAKRSCESPTASSSMPSLHCTASTRSMLVVGDIAVHGVPSPSSTMQLLRRSVAVMAVNVINFRAEMARRSADDVRAMLTGLISSVHSAAVAARGNIDAVVGDQLLVTFNAHFSCPDPPVAACNAALQLLAAQKGQPIEMGQVQVGLAVGAVYAGHVGYSGFKSLLAVGAPLKVAALLAHLSGFPQPVVLACPVVEERVKHRFTLQPVDRVGLPELGEHAAIYARGFTVHLLKSTPVFNDGYKEWMCSAVSTEPCEDWSAAFQQAVTASSATEAQDGLRDYLDRHPDDWVARRLLNRCPRWQSAFGVVLAERPDPPNPASCSRPFPFPSFL